MAYFWKNSTFWSRLDSFPLWGKSSTINLVSFMVVFFLVKLISFMVKNIKGKFPIRIKIIKGKFPIRIKIITSILVW